MTITPADIASIEEQLGRVPRGLIEVAWRCPNGNPGVVKTAPRLPDGTPFPTMYYLTCPTLTSHCSTLEADGVMADMTTRLGIDEELAAAYQAAHDSYVTERRRFGDVPEIDGVSAGGMPTRVKCLHALVGHALAVGAGVNPFGDEAVTMIAQRWPSSCVAGESR